MADQTLREAIQALIHRCRSTEYDGQYVAERFDIANELEQMLVDTFVPQVQPEFTKMRQAPATKGGRATAKATRKRQR